MATLVSRVTLSQAANESVPAWSLELDADAVWGGYRCAIERAREPTREWDGTGAERLVYGLGADLRRLTVAATTRPYQPVPDLSGADLSEAVTAKVYWPDGATTTTLAGMLSGIGSDMDLLSGTSQWSLVLVGPVTLGIDPVTGAEVEEAP